MKSQWESCGRTVEGDSFIKQQFHVNIVVFARRSCGFKITVNSKHLL